VLKRPSLLTLRHRTGLPMRWWCQGNPRYDDNGLRWPNGTSVVVTKGTTASVDPTGYVNERIVGMGKLKCIDPLPSKYPLVVVRPDDGEIELEVRASEPQAAAP